MAYTYDNFVSAANAAGLRNAFSEQDLQIAQRNPEFGLSLLSLLKDNSNATTAEQQLLATEAANQLRKSYGVYNTGTLGTDSAYAGSYGTQINDLMDQIKNYGSFDYANQDEYQKLLDQITNYGSFSYANQDSYQQLLDSIVNQQPFSYDLQSDPSWGSYKKAYMREGDRASANALAQASAASGGRASSYALTAAQQAGNYYAGQLADIIPTLEQNAYSRYLSDFNNRLSSLGAMETDRAFDYQNYLNQFSQLQSGLGALQSDRDFDYENWMNEYNMLQNSLGNYQGQDATDYQRYLDAYNQAYQAEQDRLAQDQLAYENALASYQTLGYATPEVAKILGIKSGSGSTGSSGSSGSGGGGGGGTNSAKSDTKLAETKGGSTGSGGSLTVDMNSVLALGYGPISESRLNELVASGEVKEVVKGNKITFEKVEQPSTPASNNPLWNFTQSMMNKTGTSSSSAKSSGSSTKSSGSSAKKNTSGSGKNTRAKSILDRELLLY